MSNAFHHLPEAYNKWVATEERSGGSNPFMTQGDATATTLGRQMNTEQSKFGEEGVDNKFDDDDSGNMKVLILYISFPFACF